MRARVVFSDPIKLRLRRIEPFALGDKLLKTLDRFLPWGLVVVSLVLLCWGLLGMLEYAKPALNFGLQNGNFPAGLQFIHFFALVLTGAIFLFGYLKRWPHTPQATITMYAVLATICFVETIDFGAFGGGATGVMIMLIEFALYVGLSIYLLKSVAIDQHFKGSLREVDA